MTAAVRRAVARTVHENAKAEAAKKAAPVGSSPITARTRSKGSTQGQALQQTASKSKDEVSNKRKEEEAHEDLSSEDIPTEFADEDSADEDEGNAEDDFTSQRLVVRLNPKQEKKLAEGLEKIKQKSATAKTAEHKSSKSGTFVSISKQNP